MNIREHSVDIFFCFFLKIILIPKANALNIPPGYYDRKAETQRTWREFLQAVEYVQ